jgi:anion-transporting  ArsA/GET3 family ATPase
MKTQAVIVTGAGGVGKTTVATALAVTAARAGRRTLVVTVDPARRLADAIGIELDDEPRPLPGEPALWAAMLDASGSWKAVAARHTDPETAQRLVESEFFAAAASHFPASQSYAAAEEAAKFIESKVWDLVVIDTPPSAGGIDFFTAPGQMADLVGGRLLRLLTGGRLPGRQFIFERTAKPMLRVADSVLGSNLLERVAGFLMDLRTTYDGVARRAAEIEVHLRRAITVVVTTADPTPIREAVRFFRELPEVASRPRAVIFNRSLPEAWAGAEAPARTNLELIENLTRWGQEAHRQAEARSEFAARYRARVASIPWLAHPPTDVASLAAMLDQARGLDLESLGI